MPVAMRHLYKGGRPAVSHTRTSRSRVGRPPANVSRIRNAANHTQRMKMGVDYRIRRTSQAVAAHAHPAGLTKAKRVRGSR
jgi:hypothetical protein